MVKIIATRCNRSTTKVKGADFVVGKTYYATPTDSGDMRVYDDKKKQWSTFTVRRSCMLCKPGYHYNMFFAPERNSKTFFVENKKAVNKFVVENPL